MAMNGTIRSELYLMKAMLPFIFCRLSRPKAGVVLCQDAAGANKAEPGRHGELKFGAFCLAMGSFPQQEIQRVIDDVRATGKARVLPAVGGGDVQHGVGLLQEPLVARTRLPKHWFEQDGAWNMVLARRWRRPMSIYDGELRAAGSSPVCQRHAAKRS